MNRAEADPTITLYYADGDKSTYFNKDGEIKDRAFEADDEEGGRCYELTPDSDDINKLQQHGLWIGGKNFNLTHVRTIGAGVPTAIDGITDAQEAPVMWFNLQGVNVAKPSAPGIYIRVQGNKSTKILVK